MHHLRPSFSGHFSPFFLSSLFFHLSSLLSPSSFPSQTVRPTHTHIIQVDLHGEVAGCQTKLAGCLAYIFGSCGVELRRRIASLVPPVARLLVDTIGQ